MKKLISVVLVLAMLASMMVYLPFGVSAADGAGATPETIYSEDFTGKDGTYTLAELATALGWQLLRGEGTASIDGGVLTINQTGDTDVLFLVDTDARYKANHTYQFDMEATTAVGGDTFFAGMYTGTDHGTGEEGSATAIVPKYTYEGYHNIAICKDSYIDERAHNSSKWNAASGSGYEQTRPENVLFGGGYSKYATKTTVKNVIDFNNNQVDVYTSGVRVNSTKAADYYAALNLSDYAGEGLYLRVQNGKTKDHTVKFDNIVATAGASAILANGSVVYEQNFDGITYDAATESTAALANKIGFQNLPVATGGKDYTTGESVNTTYSITDGALDILNPAKTFTATKDNNGNYKANSVGGTAIELKLYVPEMNEADKIVIEFDQQYVNKDMIGEYDGGDQPVEFQIYGRRSDCRMWFRYSQKGFVTERFYYPVNNGGFTVGQIRPQNVNFNNRVSNYTYVDQSALKATAGGGAEKHYNLYQSKDTNKIVMTKETVEWYVNDSLTMFFDLGSNYETLWQTYANDILGHLLKWYVPAGCHVQIDNIKVSVDPDDAPKLLITEAAPHGSAKSGNDEYLEVYNNSTERVNIYDYAVINQAPANTYARQKVAVSNVMFTYPGAHAFTSPSNAENTVTHTNPSYEEGWLEPGEVAYLWCATNTMYHQAATKAGNGHTLAKFRENLGLAKDVKAFVLNNDYNRSMWNNAQMIFALVDRTVFQPDYDPATGNGSQAVNADVPTGFSYFESYVFSTMSGNFAPADNQTNFLAADNTFTEGFCERPMVMDGDKKREIVSFQYRNGNTSREGRAMTVASTAGYVVDAQKRAFTATINGVKKTVYLGETLDIASLVTLEGFDQILYAKVDGQMVDLNTKIVVKGDVTVEIGDVIGFSTAPGVSLRINYDCGPGMRWLTAVNTEDLQALIEKYGEDNVQIGTLIARIADEENYPDDVDVLAKDAPLVLGENVFNEDTWEGVIRNVKAYAGEWYSDTCEYEGFAVFAGGIADMYQSNWERDYCAVGYVSVTIDGEIYTVYGESVTRNAWDLIAAALGEHQENGTTDTEDYEYLYSWYYGEE